MNGYGSHCEGCECLFLGRYGPFCCRGTVSVSILFLRSCPTVGIRCFPELKQIWQEGAWTCPSILVTGSGGGYAAIITVSVAKDA